jgi:hypothetical protein
VERRPRPRPRGRRTRYSPRTTAAPRRRDQAVIENLEARALYSTTFLVTNTNDTGAGSLRQAILDANAASGLDEIHFSIGNGGPQSIAPASPLRTSTTRSRSTVRRNRASSASR